MLSIIEIDSDDRLASAALYDLDDLGAALADLDARYLAGEAASHAKTWSVITQAYALLNRREIAATTTDLVNLDRRRVATFAPGGLNGVHARGLGTRAGSLLPLETVHRLNDLGAAVTRVTTSTSRDGFDAEWRII